MNARERKGGLVKEVYTRWSVFKKEEQGKRTAKKNGEERERLDVGRNERSEKIGHIKRRNGRVVK